MSDDEYLVAANASDVSIVAEGTVFTHFCEQCFSRVAIAPTGQRRLRAHPGMKVICVRCFPKLAESEDVEIHIPSDVVDEIRHGRKIPSPYNNSN